MNEPMRDLLESAVDRRTRGIADGRTFSDGHLDRLLRTIGVRRAATHVGMVVAVAAVLVGAGFGIDAWAGQPGDLEPGGHVTPTVAPVVTELVPNPLATAGEYYYPEFHDFYITLGATDMIPYPASGIWYPGIPDVPSDAILVHIRGDEDGYDLTDPEAFIEFDLSLAVAKVGEGLNPGDEYEVLGDVTSTSRWGVRLYFVDGDVVTLQEGRTSANAVEVTAWAEPEASS